MKMVGKVIGAVFGFLLLLLLIFRITGLEPHGRIPGLWLKGDLVTTPVTDWSFTNNYQNDMIQTRTWYFIPHTVETTMGVYKGHLYVWSAYHVPGGTAVSPNAHAVPKGIVYPHGRSWNENVARDPHVRIKIGNQLFDCILVFVTDPAEKAAVFQVRETKYPHDTVPETFWAFRVVQDLKSSVAAAQN